MHLFKGEITVRLAVGGSRESWSTMLCAYTSLRASHVQMTATGDTERLNSPAGGMYIMHVCVYVFSLANFHPVQLEWEQDGWWL